MASKRKNDSDSPWKEALEQLLGHFLAFFLPRLHEAIDWTRPYKSLDKELHQIEPESEVGRRLADKLFQVWLKNGEEAWLLIHVEVQGQRDAKFPERMFVYSYRIYDRFSRLAVSIAVLSDENPEWKPDRFEYNVFDCEMRFRFLPIKLLDYRAQEDKLQTEQNPFAAVVLAQLKLLETRDSPQERRMWKLQLFKGLYQRGIEATEIRQLLRLLDWIITLPIELEDEFRQEMYRYEEEKRMPYMMRGEKLAHEKGHEEGRQEGREEGRWEAWLASIAMDLKDFGTPGKRFLSEVRAVRDVAALQKIAKAIRSGKPLVEIRKLIR